MKDRILKTFQELKLNPDIQENTFSKNKINKRSQLGKSLDKETFISIVNTLEEIDEVSETLHEAGIEIYLHESRFYSIIESLFKILLSNEQMALLHLYLYGESMDGNIPVNNKGEAIEIDSIEELWEQINSI